MIQKNDAVIYFNRGFAKQSLEDLQGAIEDYDKAIKFDRDNARVYFNRGNAKQALGDLQGAIEDYRQSYRTIRNTLRHTSIEDLQSKLWEIYKVL